MHVLFLEVFVDLWVVPDHLWVCFDRSELQLGRWLALYAEGEKERDTDDR